MCICCRTLFVNNYTLINIIKCRHQMYYLTSIHKCYVNYELIDVIIKNVDIKVSPYGGFLLVLFKDKCHLIFIFSEWYAKICSLRVKVTVISCNATFNDISAISWRSVCICGRNQSTQRKPSTCRQSLTNSIIYRVCLVVRQRIITKANRRLPSV
jgi:hypothetical protein